MTPFLRRTLRALCLGALAFAAVGHAATAAPRKPRRVVVFGIDGADAGMFERLRAAGRLKNFDALAKRGGYARLATSNPAQSPVSWSQSLTGSNSGKTGIYDFIRRDPDIPGKLELSLASRTSIPFGPTPMGRVVLPLLLGVAAGFLGWGLVRLLLRPVKSLSDERRRRAAVVVGAVAAMAAGASLHVVLRWVPREVPKAVSNRQGVPLWSVLGEAGVKSMVIEAPVSFPADQARDLRLLSGLGTPDVQGTWGFYSVFTDDPKEIVVPETGGFVDCLAFDPAGLARSRVYGPDDLALSEDQKKKVGIEVRVAKGILDLDSNLPASPAHRFAERVAEHARKAAQASVILEVIRDTSRKTATVRLGSGGPKPLVELGLPANVPGGPAAALPAAGDSSVRWSAPVTLAEGTWSDYVAFDFVMNPVLKVRGIGKFWLESAGGAGKPFHLLLTPVAFDPRDIPPIVEISFPKDFAGLLAAKAGVYSTLGWPCMNNPVKDDLLSDEAFLRGALDLLAERRRKLKAALDDPDWRFLFVMFPEVDRLQHGFWRHIDPKSPRHDAEAAKKYGGAIDDSYVAMDAVLGEILAAGGEDTAVVVMSDHGFAPFRRSVNINTWLLGAGFQANTNKGGGADPLQTVAKLFSGERFYERLDWERTKAYAVGLGGIYLNLKGREKQGSVDPKEFDATCAAIREGLLELRDTDGSKVVHEVYLGKDLYHGPTAARFAPDLVVGFEKGYRVSWQTTLGGGGETVIEDNKFRWSGDHCSVDPSLVPGILVSSEPLGAGPAGVMDVAPTVLDLFGVTPPPEWDGKSLLAK